MLGMSRITGRSIEGDDHLLQSIGDILTTPIGSRVMRRGYGSDLPKLIDKPINSETMVDLFIATAEALERWEPRVTLRRVQLGSAVAGQIELDLELEVNGLPESLRVGVGAAA